MTIKLLLLGAALTCLKLSSNAQSLEEVSKCVVFLQHEYVETFSDQRGTFEVWLKEHGTNAFFPKIAYKAGTGFFTSRGEKRLYLITAKHIAVELGFGLLDNVIIGQNGIAVRIPLAVFRGTNTSGWLHHPKADVSVLPLNPLISIGNYLDSYSYLQGTTNCPTRDVPLTIVGFPLGIGWGRELGESFSPLTRTSRAASGFLGAGTYFFLEDPSVEGYSGAPVFDLGEALTPRGGGLLIGARSTGCYGVVAFTRADATGGKMAGVVPIKFAVEIIDNYEALNK